MVTYTILGSIHIRFIMSLAQVMIMSNRVILVNNFIAKYSKDINRPSLGLVIDLRVVFYFMWFQKNDLL